MIYTYNSQMMILTGPKGLSSVNPQRIRSFFVLRAPVSIGALLFPGTPAGAHHHSFYIPAAGTL